MEPFPPTEMSISNGIGFPNKLFHDAEFGGKYMIAHELCHALGLVEHMNSAPGELMVPSNITGDALSPFQVGIIRNSAHVTFV